MSVLSHHFQQQRKFGAQETVNAKDALLNNKANLTSSIATTPSTPSFNIKQLATEARKGTFGWEDESDEEVLLRKFDLDLAYGPCVSISRLDRYLRAEKLGLNPPQFVSYILQQQSSAAPTTKGKKAPVVESHSYLHNHV